MLWYEEKMRENRFEVKLGQAAIDSFTEHGITDWDSLAVAFLRPCSGPLPPTIHCSTCGFCTHDEAVYAKHPCEELAACVTD